MFKKGAAALGRGEYAAAIDTFEALADQGFVHPDASYDRGIAYVMRFRARGDKAGDLGRAAAAFEETLRMCQAGLRPPFLGDATPERSRCVARSGQQEALSHEFCRD